MDGKSNANDGNQKDAIAQTMSEVSSVKTPGNAASGSQGGATTSGPLSDNNKASCLENKDIIANEENEDGPEDSSTAFECPVCLQNASFPVQLPCKHIFCFLCVKGVANRSKRCALCRQIIPAEFFNAPKLIHLDELKDKSKTIFDEGYQWFYEGRNGWWQYDERTSQELEIKYKKGDKIFELLIAGFLYVIDLENMRQYRRNDQTRKRRIRRDLRSIPGIKGIAGLKFEVDQNERPSGDGGEDSTQSTTSSSGASMSSQTAGTQAQPISITSPNSDQVSALGDDTYLAPPAPNNTPQTPQTPADSPPGSMTSSQQDLSIHLQNLHLHDRSPPRATADQAVDNSASDNSDTE